MALPPSLDIDEGSVTPSGRIVPTYARQIAYRPGSSAVTSEQSPPRNNRRCAEVGTTPNPARPPSHSIGDLEASPSAFWVALIPSIESPVLASRERP
jgi:hypothetical protein